MLDLGTEINDDVESRVFGFFDGFLIYDSELEPNCLGAHRDRFLDDADAVLRLAKHIDEIRCPVLLCVVSKRGVCGHARDLARGGRNRRNGVPVLLEIEEDVMARPVRFGRGADHGNRFGSFQQGPALGR